MNVQTVISKDPFIQYLLHLADNNLILTQRNGEWCGHGPVLEQDIAITNITLDLIGQARLLYQYAAEKINKTDPSLNATEDALAYLRTEREFSNLLLLELPKGDWAVTVLRQFFYSTYQGLLFEKLMKSSDGQLSAIAEKSLKEITYHIRWSSEWVVRLGDGTEESNWRMNRATEELWMYTGELFKAAPFETAEVIGFELSELLQPWLQRIHEVFNEATLKVPSENTFMQSGGKSGIHTEHLGYVLAEMQYLQRTYPNAEW
ncbi:MAG: phenylacetate-CoA oxygenase subunit PaaI [Chitinophagaceae bacterium]|nr:MAG: phenylacetate-CoA oxygenase subunit PaaI [Chitinophagaceae bacterium]